MQLSLKLTRDAITPALARAIRAIRATGKPRPILQAAGLRLKELTQSAFFNAAIRPAPWAVRKSGGSVQSDLLARISDAGTA